MRNGRAVILVVISLAQSSPARADDVGELRQRIEALENEREAQQERIDKLEAEIEKLRAEAPPPATAPAQVIPGILNPALSVIGNFVFRGSDTKTFNEDGDRVDNRANLRETELDLRAAVDPYADAVFIATLESEAPGEFETGVEEGFLNVKKLPFLDEMPLGLKLKLGRFRPAFGRLNILHTHDLPQTTRPLVIEELLGPEGFIQDGAAGQFFLPTPWDESSALDLTVQATSGDLAVAPDGKNDAGFLGHLRWFRTFFDEHSAELGWSTYYGRTDSPLLETYLHGADWLYKWRPLRGGQARSFLLGGEWLFADREFLEPPAEESTEPAVKRRNRPRGLYLFAQAQPATRWYLGVRGDWTEALDDDALERRGVTPYVSYYFSEFLRFRLNYEHLWSDREEEDDRNSVFLEANFLIGSHPPEPFWVEK